MSYSAASGPRLVVIVRPVLDVDAVTRFLADEGLEWRRTPGALQAEELVEVAGRMCYLSFGERQSPRTNREYIDNLVTAGHHSVLEHATWTFLLAGVTRAFTHQLVRHRIGFSYSQLSQQYHDERQAEPMMPDVIREDPELVDIWLQAVENGREAYQALMAKLEGRASVLPDAEWRRMIRSAARTVLPAAVETQIAFTANARSLRHFLAERGHLPGDEEMRRVTVLLLETMMSEAPVLFRDFVIVHGPEGAEAIQSKA